VGIAMIACDALLKLVGGQVIHQLGEDSLAEIHSSLSAIEAGLEDNGAGASFRRKKLKSKKLNLLLDH
jgi:hypothetical protein